VADERGAKVLSAVDVQFVVDAVRYKDGYDFDLEINEDIEGNVEWWISLTVRRVDALTGEPGVGHAVPRVVSPYMTESQIVRMMFGMAMGYEEHECREFFRYDGKAVFGPHISVRSLVDIADDVD
jgi:hypothetical protein